MRSKLWGDNFFDSKGKKWVKNNKGTDDILLQRAFVQFIMDPIIKLTNTIIEGKKKKVKKMIKGCGVKLNTEEKQLEGKKLLKLVM